MVLEAVWSDAVGGSSSSADLSHFPDVDLQEYFNHTTRSAKQNGTSSKAPQDRRDPSSETSRRTDLQHRCAPRIPHRIQQEKDGQKRAGARAGHTRGERGKNQGAEGGKNACHRSSEVEAHTDMN